MKILPDKITLTVAHVIYSFDTGGREKGVVTLVNHGSPDIRHVIICLTRSGASEKLLTKKTPVISLSRKDKNSLFFIIRLARVLKRLHPDVVHTRNWSGMDGIAAATLAGVKKRVHSEHGWDSFDPQGANRKRKIIRRFASLFVRHYLCVSKSIEYWLLNNVRIKAPVQQIYNGVDTDRFRPATHKRDIREQLGLPTAHFIVITVGRLDPIKDHLTLLKAFQTLAPEKRNMTLVIVGDGPERRKLESNACPHTVLAGRRTDIQKWLQASDLFVLCSLNEGVSNTILEAMASGLAVIATAVGGNRELVVNMETGLTVAPQNPQALAEAMETYLKHPDLAVLHGKNGRLRAVKKFSIKAMVDAYEKAYRA